MSRNSHSKDDITSFLSSIGPTYEEALNQLRTAYHHVARKVGKWREKLTSDPDLLNDVVQHLGPRWAHVNRTDLANTITTACKNPKVYGGGWADPNNKRGHGGASGKEIAARMRADGMDEELIRYYVWGGDRPPVPGHVPF